MRSQISGTVLTAVLATATILSLLASPPPAAAEAVSYRIDPTHSSVGFSIRHLVGRVKGRFNEIAGVIVYDPASPAASRVSFTVQAGSIDTDDERRDGHLRSPDFFDVDRFPEITFESRQVESAGEGRLRVTGTLGLHGVTNEITVEVEVLGLLAAPGGAVAGFETSFVLVRDDYGITWNERLDQGFVLGNEVAIEILVEAREGVELEAGVTGGPVEG